MMDLRIDTSGLDKLAKQVEAFGGNAKKVQARIVNRALTSAASAMQKTIRAQYVIKAGDVKDAIKKHNAKESDVTATLSVNGRLLSMAHFQYTPKSPSQPPKGANRTKTGRAKKRKKTKLKIRKGPFIPARKGVFVAESSGALNVFRREGAARLPIAPLRTISIPQMASSRKVHKATVEAAEQTMQKRIPVELQYELDKATGKR